MPFPKLTTHSVLYMAQLDALSAPCAKPVLFVRGTQKRILTVDS